MRNSLYEIIIPFIRGLSFDGEKGRFIKSENNPEKIEKLKQKINEFSRVGKLLNPPLIMEFLRAEEFSEEKRNDTLAKFSQDYQQYLKQHQYHPQIIILGKEILLFSGSTYSESLVIQNDPFTELRHIPAHTKDRARPEFETNKFIEGKVIVVTGGAQGIGAYLVRSLVKRDAFLWVADINKEGAEQLVEELNHFYNKKCALALKVDVTDEPSVQEMIKEIVKEVGGIDVFISNAGILKAGSVKNMDYQDFQLVNKVNYFGYFLCAKYASRIMTWQNKGHPDYITDIIQINSKSGLEGSYKNCAYAGSKFAGIGLTQSLAKELIEDNIKVNSICPGNFLMVLSGLIPRKVFLYNI
ncbi:MAG: hypothetical protein Kow00103_02950 [Candidatus Caldatribacteriota bacterium]